MLKRQILRYQFGFIFNSNNDIGIIHIQYICGSNKWLHSFYLWIHSVSLCHQLLEWFYLLIIWSWKGCFQVLSKGFVLSWLSIHHRFLTFFVIQQSLFLSIDGARYFSKPECYSSTFHLTNLRLCKAELACFVLFFLDTGGCFGWRHHIKRHILAHSAQQMILCTAKKPTHIFGKRSCFYVSNIVKIMITLRKLREERVF